MEISDNDELMRYLNGEIQFTEWKEGQDMLEVLSSEENISATLKAREDDDEETDESEDEQEAGEEESASDEDKPDPRDLDYEEENEEMEDEDEEETIDENDKEYVPPGTKMTGKVGRPSKPLPESLTPKRGPGRPKGSGTKKTNVCLSSDNSPMSHELQLAHEERRQKTKRGARGTHSRVPKALRGLMGEAHLCFARGAHQEAIMMCLEIIRQVPRCPDTYQLLGMIYEDKQDMEKALQFSLLAAHLNPSDHDEWVHCAEMCLEQDDIPKAIDCYTKAIRGNPKDICNHMERIHLHEQLGDKKKVLDCYQALLKALPEDRGEEYVQLARELVKVHHENGDVAAAMEVFEMAFARHATLVSSEDVNMLAELQIANRQYLRAVQVISDQCGIAIRSKMDDNIINMEQLSLADGESRQDLMSITIPERLPIDLRAKMGVCLIHLKQFEMAEDVLQALLVKLPEEVGDLFLDVTEAYMDVGCYSKARPLLQVLTETENYNLAAVWLRFADCLTSLGELDLSIAAYHQVLDRAPGHLDARIALSTLELQKGNSELALELLLYNTGDGFDVQLIWQRAVLLYARERWVEFCKDALMLLRTYVKEAYEHHGGNVTDELIGDISCIGQEEWFSLFKKTLDALAKTGQLDEAVTISSAVIMSRRFRDPTRQRNAEFMGLCCCFLNRNYKVAYSEIRWFVKRNPNNAAAWNLFSLITNLTNDTRHHRFCMRLTIKKLRQNLALCILNGHNAMVSGTFKNAVSEYVRGLRQRPDDPLLNLMIGISIFHIACQKYTTKRHSLIVQGFAFLKRYEDYRGVSQETCYNIGRALQQIGMLQIAVAYYHQGLDLAPSIDDPTFDLRHEIAFNLSLIYQHSGNEEMATGLLRNNVI